MLNDKFAICDAYSVTFKGFMDYLDIPCILIASFPMSHVWNMVKLDDDCWYHVDVTWDDPGWNDEEWEMGWINYQHLVRNDAGISINHYGWAEEYFPVANGTLYEDYFDHNYIRQLKSSDFED